MGFVKVVFKNVYKKLYVLTFYNINKYSTNISNIKYRKWF